VWYCAELARIKCVWYCAELTRVWYVWYCAERHTKPCTRVTNSIRVHELLKSCARDTMSYARVTKSMLLSYYERS